MHLVNSESDNGNNRRSREEVGGPEPISTMDGSIGLSRLRPGLDFLQSVRSLAVSLAGSRPDPHTVQRYTQSGFPAQEILSSSSSQDPSLWGSVESKWPLQGMCSCRVLERSSAPQVLLSPPLVSILKMYVSFDSAIQLLGISPTHVITCTQAYRNKYVR